MLKAWRSPVRVPVEADQMGTGGSFPREVKRQAREASHSPPSSAEFKKV
jgi:hypothetical protein